jgi:3-deoxy-7-phosphoheptulonate synthase
MIIVIKKGLKPENIQDVLNKIKDLGANPYIVEGRDQMTVSVLGKTEKISLTALEVFPEIESVMRVSKPFKLASLAAKPQGSVFDIKGVKFGPGHFNVMAGPCSVESEDQTMRIARAVKKSGATIIRGGAFKPRSSPYAFQGMGLEGLKILQQASKETGLPIVSEAMDFDGLKMMMDYVDIIQIGARNMQNFALLKELGKIDKPILLKRGMSATVEEWLMSAEYILAGGNSKVILCERGIRTFDTQYSRNTLDLNVVPILKSLTHLPVVVDPSHGTGHRHLVAPMALAGMAAGADSLIVEVHDKPEEALSDGPQALLPSDFSALMLKIVNMGEIMGRNVQTEIPLKKAS